LKGNDIFTSMSWSANGNTLVTTSRDKKLRFWDVRQEKPAHEIPGHGGAKSSRVVWMGDHDRVVTTGFSKMSERQLGLWDTRNPTLPIGDFMPLDSGSGIGMPFWDDGCQMLYLAGKGDGNIRYYEYQNDKFEYLSEYRSPNPQRGIAFLPKRGVNTRDNEVMRAFKSVDDTYIEPISFIVPRRAETFQDDIYPPSVGTEPAVSSPEWFSGKTGLPPKLNMGDLFDGKEPQLIAAEDAPKPTTTTPAAPTPAVAPKAEPKPEPKPEPTPAPALARELPSVNQNKQSMATMAEKFADKDETEDDVKGDSTFEEIPKPVQRPAVAAARQADVSRPQSAESRVSDAPPSEPKPDANSSEGSSESKPTASTSSIPVPSPSAAAGGLRDVLNEIKTMLQSQAKQIEHLTSEVAQLKAKVGE
jgi:coronin-1B/1C/6